MYISELYGCSGDQRLRLRTERTADEGDDFGALAFLTLAGLAFLAASEPRFERLERTLDFVVVAGFSTASVSDPVSPAAASSAFSAASLRAASSSREGTQSLFSKDSRRFCMLS